MRGKGVSGFSLTSVSRITPAYAGKRAQFNFCFVCTEDHPRLCGEKFSARSFKYLSMGSPPPMRGKGGVKVLSATERRITPAYAGKSCITYLGLSEWRDHPRLCGEKPAVSHQGCPPEGSPPPMRGKGRLTGNFHCLYRITPAYAGKRFAGNVRGLIVQDHPRLCGEKQCTRFAFAVIIGSPPPMRGKGSCHNFPVLK